MKKVTLEDKNLRWLLAAAGYMLLMQQPAAMLNFYFLK
jgi:hypothetical protein